MRDPLGHLPAVLHPGPPRAAVWPAPPGVALLARCLSRPDVVDLLRRAVSGRCPRHARCRVEINKHEVACCDRLAIWSRPTDVLRERLTGEEPGGPDDTLSTAFALAWLDARNVLVLERELTATFGLRHAVLPAAERELGRAAAARFVPWCTFFESLRVASTGVLGLPAILSERDLRLLRYIRALFGRNVPDSLATDIEEVVLLLRERGLVHRPPDRPQVLYWGSWSLYR